MTDSQQPAPFLPPDEICEFCGAFVPGLGSYCPRCGAAKPSLRYAGIPPAADRRTGYTVSYRQPSLRASLRKFAKTISAYVMLTLVIQIVLSIVALLYGIQFVVPAILDEWSGFGLFIILPVVITIATLSGYTLLVYYFFLIGAIAASCVWVLVSSIDTFPKELSLKAKSRVHSPLFETCGLLFATLFFSVLIGLIANPSEDELPEAGTLAENLFLLANASVWEELIVRVLLIGLPLLVIHAALRSPRPKLYSYLLGGGFKMGAPEVVLVVLSSVLFGYAHYASGWGAWKILPAAVGGLAFGYLFLKFGLAASIMMHFGTDYLSMPISVFDSVGLDFLTAVGILLWLAFGVMFFIYYITRIFEYLARRDLSDTGGAVPVAAAPHAPTPAYKPLYMGNATVSQPGIPPPPPAPTPDQPRSTQTVFGGGYVCPVCGGVEARWVDGRFQCLRCGH